MHSKFLFFLLLLSLGLSLSSSSVSVFYLLLLLYFFFSSSFYLCLSSSSSLSKAFNQLTCSPRELPNTPDTGRPGLSGSQAGRWADPRAAAAPISRDAWGVWYLPPALLGTWPSRCPLAIVLCYGPEWMIPAGAADCFHRHRGSQKSTEWTWNDPSCRVTGGFIRRAGTLY